MQKQIVTLETLLNMREETETAEALEVTLSMKEEAERAAYDCMIAMRNNAKQVAEEYVACRRKVAEAAVEAYYGERARLTQKIASLAADNKRLMKRARRLRSEARELRERGDLMAADDKMQRACECEDTVMLNRGRASECGVLLNRMRRPQSGYERWLKPDSELMVGYEALRRQLKCARQAYNRSRTEFEWLKAMTKATRRELEALIDAEMTDEPLSAEA